MRKYNTEIGRRAYQEALRLIAASKEGTLLGWCRQTRLGKNAVYRWNDGSSPDSVALAKLHYAGADVLYILTGRRTEK